VVAVLDGVTKAAHRGRAEGGPEVRQHAVDVDADPE
jgi:hypothetical protein